jgi:hypothetical protein
MYADLLGQIMDCLRSGARIPVHLRAESASRAVPPTLCWSWPVSALLLTRRRGRWNVI